MFDWIRRYGVLKKRDDFWGELDEELKEHVRMMAEDFERQGMAPREARQKALREFGSVDQIREQAYEAWGLRVITDLIRNVRASARSLVKSLGFSLSVVTTLALCVGANVAMFAVIDAILVRALPYPQAERLVTVFNSIPGYGLDRLRVSLPNYYERRGELKSFESLSIHRDASAVVGDEDSIRRLEGFFVSPEFFDTLETRLAMGRRNFTEEETHPDNARVTIITHELWQEEFSGELDALGRSLRLDGQPYQVVGVLAQGFDFLESGAAFFRPLASELEDRQGSGRYNRNNYGMIGRLRPGATVEDAQREVDAHNERLMEGISKARAADLKKAGYRSFVYNLHEDIVRSARPTLLILQAGAFALLLIGIVNLMNVFLIRAKSRATETAVRQSIGAGRLQIAKEIGIETLMLAFVGGGLGLLVGAVGIRMLDTLGTDQLPFGSSIALDGRVIAVSLAGTLCVGIALALPIIISSFRGNLSLALKAESRSGTGSRSSQNARNVFIVTQIALAFALLSAAGVLGLSLRKTLDTSPGFQAEDVFTAILGLPSAKYPEIHHVQSFISRLRDELEAMPGVEHVGLTSALPFSYRPDDNTIIVVGRTLEPGESHLSHFTGFVSGDYWQALGIPLIEGRFLEESDNREDLRVCVVDESVAKRYWPDQSAIGRLIRKAGERDPITIVGVVGTVKTQDLTESDPLGIVYAPLRLNPSRWMALALRTKMDTEALVPMINDVVRSIDPELPVDGARIMQERIDESLVMRRSPAVLAIAFASVALLLAAVGTYSVIAFAVSQRRREIGIRIALGARPSAVLKQFVGIGIRLLVAGIALGTVGAWYAGLGMKSVLFEVAPFHPNILLATAAILSIVVLFAISLPSNRASRVDPVEAMNGGQNS